MTWIRFDNNISEASIPNDVSTFVTRIGYKKFDERISKLKQRMRDNPFANYLFLERYSLEFVIWDVFSFLKTYGRLPRDFTSHYYAYFFVAIFNRLYSALPSTFQARLVGRVHHGFVDENDLRSLAREFTIVAHLINLGCKIQCHDFEEGGFDFLCLRDGLEFEVECKTVSVDKGRQIHQYDILRLSDYLKDQVLSHTNQDSGMGYILSISVPARLSNSPTILTALAADIVNAFRAGMTIAKDDWRILFVKFPIKGSPYDTGKRFDAELTRTFVKNLVPESTSQLLLSVKPGKSAVILDVHSKKPDKYIEGIYRELKSAAGQFSGSRPSILWTALIDLASNVLEAIANEAKNNGLAAIATRLLRNSSRAHLHTVIFSGEPFIKRGGDGSVASEGKTYRFQNPNHSFADDPRLKV